MRCTGFGCTPPWIWVHSALDFGAYYGLRCTADARVAVQGSGLAKIGNLVPDTWTNEIYAVLRNSEDEIFHSAATLSARLTNKKCQRHDRESAYSITYAIALNGSAGFVAPTVSCTSRPKNSYEQCRASERPPGLAVESGTATYTARVRALRQLSSVRAESSFWRSLIPNRCAEKARSRCGSPAENEAEVEGVEPCDLLHRHIRPHGSMSIRMIVLKRDFETFSRQSDVRIGLLREVVGRSRRARRSMSSGSWGRATPRRKRSGKRVSLLFEPNLDWGTHRLDRFAGSPSRDRTRRPFPGPEEARKETGRRALSPHAIHRRRGELARRAPPNRRPGRGPGRQISSKHVAYYTVGGGRAPHLREHVL